MNEEQFRRWTTRLLWAMVAGVLLIQAIGLLYIVRINNGENHRRDQLLAAIVEVARESQAQSVANGRTLFENRRQGRCNLWIILSAQRAVLVAVGISPKESRRAVRLPNVKGLHCSRLISRPIPPVVVPGDGVAGPQPAPNPSPSPSPTPTRSHPPCRPPSRCRGHHHHCCVPTN